MKLGMFVHFILTIPSLEEKEQVRKQNKQMVQRIEKIMSGNSSIAHTNRAYMKSKSRQRTPSRNNSVSHMPNKAAATDTESSKYNFLANFKKI